MNGPQWITGNHRKSCCSVFLGGITIFFFSHFSIWKEIWVWMAFYIFLLDCNRNRRYPIFTLKLLGGAMKIGPISEILGSLVNDDRSMRVAAENVYWPGQNWCRGKWKNNAIVFYQIPQSIPQNRALSLKILIGHKTFQFYVSMIAYYRCE